MSTNKPISEGDFFLCPHCQTSSFAKSHSEYDGFSLKRRYLACAFCQAEIGIKKEAKATDKPTAKSHAAEKLSSLFGEVQTADEPVMSELLSDDKQRHFCKNCRHNFVTPFKCHCNLHQKEVEPLHDCPDFEAKKTATSL